MGCRWWTREGAAGEGRAGGAWGGYGVKGGFVGGGADGRPATVAQSTGTMRSAEMPHMLCP